MVQIRQDEDEIKVIIELNRLITRKPDVVLLPTYLKFNTPPIFFERHLTQEIDEMASFCRIFKNEACIVLVKKQKGIWPEIFQNLSKEELLKRRLEISDQIVERSKERDQKVIERYELKRRNEIDKEVRREMAMATRVKEFERNACREALTIGGKETHSRIEHSNGNSTVNVRSQSQFQPTAHVAAPAAIVRNSGRIRVSFSNFNLNTPKRESQDGKFHPLANLNTLSTLTNKSEDERNHTENIGKD